jgi:hypothetical protein
MAKFYVYLQTKYKTMEKATRIEDIIQAFDKLPLNNKEDLEKFYCETIEVRMGENRPSPIDDLFNACKTTKGKNAHLLMGHRGCGKSTELNNLKFRFEEEGLPVTIIDCNLETNLFTVNHFDILYLIFLSLLKITEENDISLDLKWVVSTLQYFKSDISEVIIEEQKINDVIDAGANIPDFLKKILPFFIDIKTDLQLNTSNSIEVRTKIEREAGKCLNYINELKDKIVLKLKKNPIIIFEDLDKVIPETRALDIFSYYVLGQMQFPVIYTFPISLSYTERFTDLEGIYNFLTLPMIKVKNREDNSICEKGINTIKKIVEKRAEISLFQEDALKYLILKTGGLLRDVFSCVMLAAKCAIHRNIFADKIEQIDVEIALTDLKSMMTRRLETKNYEPLLKIHNSKSEIDDRSAMLKFFQAHLVLEYNGARWCDVHPLILDFIKERLDARPELMNN